MRKPEHAMGLKSEVRVAKTLGVEPTIASGALLGAKSDFRLRKDWSDWQGECKATTAMTYPLSYNLLKKLEYEAKANASLPMFAVSYTTLDGKSKPSGDWVALRLDDVVYLLDTIDELLADRPR